MTINQLRYALTLSRHGNFKRAAEQLDISQPALSIQIQKLEDHVGFRLFNRTVNPIEVTRDGHEFLLKAQKIIDGVNHLENFSREVQEDFSGQLNIGIIPTLSPFLVPLFINSLEEDYSKLKLVIKEEITEKVINAVRNRELDVGIISTPIQAYGIRAIPLFYEKFYVYTTEDRPKSEYSPSEISNYKVWLLGEGNCFRDQINNFCDLKSDNGDSLVYESNSIDSLIRIVDTKGGMTILPELSSLCLSAEQEENLKRISGKAKVREISLIVPGKYEKERYIEVLKEYILKNIPHHMTEKGDFEVVDPNVKFK